GNPAVGNYLLLGTVFKKHKKRITRSTSLGNGSFSAHKSMHGINAFVLNQNFQRGRSCDAVKCVTCRQPDRSSASYFGECYNSGLVVIARNRRAARKKQSRLNRFAAPIRISCNYGVYGLSCLLHFRLAFYFYRRKDGRHVFVNDRQSVLCEKWTCFNMVVARMNADNFVSVNVMYGCQACRVKANVISISRRPFSVHIVERAVFVNQLTAELDLLLFSNTAWAYNS